MTRILLYIIKAALLIGAAVWLAEHPGRIAIDWEGWRIDSNLAVLAVILAMTLAAALAAYRLWQLMREGAGGWRRRRQAKRLHSGYQAFTQGMIALAAGDTAQARRQAHRTLALGDRQPLGLLLRAQAAQIDGDRKEAEAALRAMLEQPLTAFLGLRGLTAMALRDGAEDEALAFAERALTLRPQAQWAIQTLCDIRIRQGAWQAAWDAIDAAAAARMWDKAQLNRRRALILLGQARDAQSRAQSQNDARDALLYAEKAVELAIDLVPASVLKAECLLALERPAKAAAAIERVWAKHPHPDLARLYLSASKSQGPLAQVKCCQDLLALAPNAAEGHLAMADTARLACLWGEARAHYRAAAADPLTRGRACQGLALVEESSQGDIAKALIWLKDAATAPPAPGWRCHRCGTGRDRWQAHCPACGEIDGLRWTGESESAERSQIPGDGKLVY